MRETSAQKKKKPVPRAAWWALALLAAAAAAGALVYFWRVFYYLDARGVPALPLYLGAAGLACLAVGAAALGHFVCKRFEAKAVLAVALAGGRALRLSLPQEQLPERLPMTRLASASLA